MKNPTTEEKTMSWLYKILSEVMVNCVEESQLERNGNTVKLSITFSGSGSLQPKKDIVTKAKHVYDLAVREKFSE